MKDIFTDLYKKVVGFFQKEEIENKENVKEVAYNRLKLVLMQDRTNLTPYLLERMRGEMIDVLSKYVEMDKEALELNFEQEGDSMALMLSIPVLRAKDEEEIQAALDAQDKEKEDEKDEEDNSQSDDDNDNEETETDECSEENDCEECDCEKSCDCEDDEECHCEECKCEECNCENCDDEECDCDCENKEIEDTENLENKEKKVNSTNSKSKKNK